MLSSEGAPKIVVVGVGEGCNIVNKLSGVTTIDIDELATKSDEQEISGLFEADIVFVCGNIGTSVTPIIAKAKERGAIVVVFVERAREEIEEIRKHADTVIVLSDDRLPVDQIVAETIKWISELLKPSPVIDLADIRDLMKNGGIAVMLFGEAKGKEVVEAFDVDYKGSTGALILISGGLDLTIRDVEDIVAELSSKMNVNNVIWGAKIEKELEDTIRVIAIVTGVRL